MSKMSTNENNNVTPICAKKPYLRPKRVTVSLQAEQRRLSDLLLSANCPIFLDTNILIWSFGLNAKASLAWQKWLLWLGERLVIPAWVVHEYNQHTNQPDVANPYKALFRKLQAALDELSDSASRALDDTCAADVGCSSKIELEYKLGESSAFALRIAKAVSQSDRGHRADLLKFYESLLDERTHCIDIHELSLQAHKEFSARATLILSPGGEDFDKPANQCGDLIIWKEVLQYCVKAGLSQALFVSNDVKRDWCYTPMKLVLDGGKEIPFSKEAAQDLRLPNPELVAEFQKHTGGDSLVLATIDQVIEILGSTTYNAIDAVEFTELAQALKASRTPTDQAVEWIRRYEDIYRAGLLGTAAWDASPSEVDMDAFEAWCREQMKDSSIPLDKVNWMQVFVALYL